MARAINWKPRKMTQSEWIELQAETAEAMVEYWAAENGVRVWRAAEGDGQEFTDKAQDAFNDFYDQVEVFLTEALGPRPE